MSLWTSARQYCIDGLTWEKAGMRSSAARTMSTIVLLTVAAVVMLVLAGSASAAGPRLSVTQQSYPTKLVPGGTGAYEITVENAGNQDTTGPITITDTLPPGVTAVSAGDYINNGPVGITWDCPGAAGATVVTCTYVETYFPSIAAHERAFLPLRILVTVDPSVASSATNSARVSGVDRSAMRCRGL